MATNNSRKTKAERVADSRARARQMQEQQRRRERRNRTIAIWGTVGAIVLVVGLVIAFVLTRGSQSIPDQGEAASIANQQGGVTMTGKKTLAEPKDKLGAEVDASTVNVPEEPSEEQPESIPGAEEPADGDPAQIVIYADFNCSHCAEFEERNNGYLQDLMAEGKATVEYRMVGFLDRPGTGNYSSRAAAASYCVAEEAPESYDAFVSDVFATYSQKSGAGLSDDELIAIANSAGADISSCVKDGTYRPMVKYTTAKAQEAKIPGTPGVFVNGKNWAVDGKDQSFQEFADAQMGDE
ncbi:DSBA oxidoreductase [Micrococcus lylae]|uniref:DSBA oxidoreductase n=1 Tax=Micrococcus lylae TaxID=1273 RepID=A0A1R4II26_9MICC|nr:thioredoxin domain-containing protein [Micrococcus lylae]SJN19379.1 DSBA oxidoreductase [Micrococcus lylae]